MLDKKFLENKRIGITGGTGSFGSTLLEYLIENEICDCVVFSRDETKQEILRKKFTGRNIEFIIGDVRDRKSLDRFASKVEYVFHAAAMKYVPSTEIHPFEAVKTNIIGSNNLLDACDYNGVSKVVLLSTDKAVEPINAMGISKAMMEKLGISRCFDDSYKSSVCITRYGNVMGSRGSVIPMFIDGLLAGRELTVTNMAMTRFMMSLSDSVSLVLHALRNGHAGEIFVQKAPSADIKTLILSLEEIFKTKARVKVIGNRHSEKMHESLLSQEEMCRAKDIGQYFTVEPDLRGVDYVLAPKSFDSVGVSEFSSANTKRLSVNELTEILLDQDFVAKYL